MTEVTMNNSATGAQASTTPEPRWMSETVLADPATLLSLLESWVELGWLRALDLALVRFVSHQAEAAGQPLSPLLMLGIALSSHQLGRGHVCLDLDAMTREGFNDALSLPPEDDVAPDERLLPSDILRDTALGDWETALDLPLVVADVADGEHSSSPLVRDGHRLYLRRYWQYEQAIFHQLSDRLAPLTQLQDPSGVGARALAGALDALFGGVDADGAVDWQRVACANAARQGFSVITGGPGTGKTTTVVKLLAALQSVALSLSAGARSLRIRLAAPTGKAAARLNESLAGAVDGLDLSGLHNGEAIRAAIPVEVTTVHRLLGSIPGSRKFRHHRHNPLVADVLVIDEASMVDIEMMARVLEATPPHARLILLGDKDQLASVDAGAVLGEFCQRAAGGHYTPATAGWLAQVAGTVIAPELLDGAGTALDQAITMLRKSYRFTADSGIGQLATAVNQPASGDAATEAARVLQGGFVDIARAAINRTEPEPQVTRHCLGGGAASFPGGGEGRLIQGRPVAPPEGYRHYLGVMKRARPAADADWPRWEQWAGQVLEAYNRFQLLCALRRGPFGVEGLNQAIIAALSKDKLISTGEGWFAGRPVMVTRNDYSLGLMNGDIGITLEVPARHWLNGREVIDPDHRVIRVAFPAGDGSGGVRWVLPSRLQGVETVFAMTVHKSQGSEFAHTCLVLPDRINPVLTRELVYTGITRAKHWFSLLVPDQQVFDQAVGRRVIRTSGLGRMLFG